MSEKLDRGIFERSGDIQILASLTPLQNPALAARRPTLDRLQQTYPDYA
ncbi:MAG: hypothetical protein RLZZ387_1249 [Chloroflexota bacterium]